VSAISAIGISARRAEGVPVRDGGNDSLHRERRDIQSRGRRGKPDEGDVEPAVADVFQRTPCGRRLGDDLDPGMARSEGRDRGWKHGRDGIDDMSEPQPPDRAGTRVARGASGFVRVPEQPAYLVEEHRRREAVASASADGRLLALHRMVQRGVRRTSHALCGRCSRDPHYAAHRSALDLVLMTCPNPVGLAVLGLVDG